MEEAEESKVNKNSPTTTIIALVTVLVLALGFYYGLQAYRENSDNSNPVEMPSPSIEPVQSISPALDSSESAVMMEENDNSQLIEVSMEGGAYYFKPSTISARVGDTIKLTLTSVDMPHDFVIDDLNVKSSVVTNGKSTEVVFKLEKAGEFEYYCSVGNHKAKGMVGTLVVSE